MAGSRPVIAHVPLQARRMVWIMLLPQVATQREGLGRPKLALGGGTPNAKSLDGPDFALYIGASSSGDAAHRSLRLGPETFTQAYLQRAEFPTIGDIKMNRSWTFFAAASLLVLAACSKKTSDAQSSTAVVIPASSATAAAQFPTSPASDPSLPSASIVASAPETMAPSTPASPAIAPGKPSAVASGTSGP